VKILPAIDLKDNKCVRLTKGEEISTKIYNENPTDQAKYFEDQGCERLHLVDLDAAFGRPNINKKTILNIRKSIKIPIQLGGGIRSREIAEFWLINNIDFLIIGSMAIKESNTVQLLAENFEKRIYIALDLLNSKKIMINGWVKDSKLTTQDVERIYLNSKIKGYIITNIDKDGMMEGPGIEFLRNHLNIYSKPIIFSGGFSDYENLKSLCIINNKLTKNQKIEGIIIGKALYSGKIKIKKAIETVIKYAQN